jgi:hypothetical protein
MIEVSFLGRTYLIPQDKKAKFDTMVEQHVIADRIMPSFTLIVASDILREFKEYLTN